MPAIKSIHIAPVKSLALISPSKVQLGARGIEEDRRFLLIDDAGAMITQRQIGKIAQVSADYCIATDTLRLDFPSGESVSASPELGDCVETKVFRRMVSGKVDTGELSQALSDFCGAKLSLVMTDNPGECFDAYPVTLLSQASIERLGDVAQDKIPQHSVDLEYRRFRPNFLLEGCDAHEEDSWLGKEVSVGDEVRLRVEALDPRCAITTLNPDTGERDMDTPRLILGYRPYATYKAACFGVYGSVVTSGSVSVGDELRIADRLAD